MNPIVYIDVYQCGQVIWTLGFEQHKNDDILTHLARIENVFKEMKSRNEWDKYEIVHICRHDPCPKMKGDIEIIRPKNKNP